MVAEARFWGVRAGGGQDEAGSRKRSGALQPPLPPFSFLFLLLLAAHGVWAAGYQVSVGPRAEMSFNFQSEAPSRIRVCGWLSSVVTSDWLLI